MSRGIKSSLLSNLIAWGKSSADGSLAEEILSTSNAMHVFLSGASGFSGDAQTCVLVADTADPGANDVLTDVDGYKSFEAISAGALTIGTGLVATEGIAVAWSTAAGDHVGVAALLADAVAQFVAAPTTPPVIIPNCRIMRETNDIVSIGFDGTTTIKTIGVRCVGITPAAGNVLINVVS